MIKLALDLGTVTGWCYGAGADTPALGTIKMPSTDEEVGPFLDVFYRWLHAKVTEIQTDYELPTKAGSFGEVCVDPQALVACMEAPFLPPDRWDHAKKKLVRQTTITTTRKLQGLAGIVEMVCLQRGVPISEVSGPTVKKAMGSGSNEKPDMVASARRAGLNVTDHNAADAFGVWVCMLSHYDRESFVVWDQKIRDKSEHLV